VVASIVVGGFYLLAVDTIARYALSIEIPLGILTAIIGAPFFIPYLRNTTGVSLWMEVSATARFIRASWRTSEA